MHPALFKLIRLQIRATRRHVFRGLKSWRGIFFFAFALLLFGAWILPSVTMAMGEKPDRFGMFADAVPDVIPIGLMLICVVMAVSSAGQKAIQFTPSEVDFLFAGPFGRKELLAYRLLRGALGLVFTSLIFSLAFLIYINSWLAGFLGCFLTALFVQLWSMTFALIGQVLGNRIHGWVRVAVVAVAGVLTAIALLQVLEAGRLEDFPEYFRKFRESTAGIWLTAPFNAFGRVITADGLFPDLVVWGGVALVINGVLLAVVMRLDADYLESAAQAGRHAYERIQRFKRGGALVGAKPVGVRLKLPRFPWMHGAGPLAWRQIIKAIRISRAMLGLTLLMFAVGIFLTLAFQRRHEGAPTGTIAGLVVMAYMSFLITMQVPLAFRGDLDLMDRLKALPFHSIALAAGELIGFVLFLTGVQLAFLACIAPFARGGAWILTAAGLFTLPFNLIMISVENLFFLIFPTRMVATTPGDLQFIGRTMVFFFLKVLILILCLGVVALVALLAFFVTGRSWMIAAATAWITMAIAGAALVCGVARAFDRFDVSVDTPA